MFDFFRRCLWIIPAIASIFNFYPSKVFKATQPAKEFFPNEKVYDFVIVGGGTAGCIVANRLSEDPSNSVLLIEAGRDEPIEATIPAIAPYLQLTEIDWQYQAAPSSTSCLAMKDNRCNLPRGKVLGGSGAINFMIYVRGNRNDYDSWRTFGNPGWAYEDVLPFFKKSERNGDYFEDEDYHGTSGYQPINKPKWRTPLADAFLEAGLEMGYPTLDVNAESQVGFMFPQAFYKKGSRYSSSHSFLEPIKERINLHIALNSMVTQIHFDSQKRVTGVSYENKGKNLTALVRKEVVLSAGALGSPHLLMLSGIGPAENLRSHNIPVLVNLPVGRNLQDHIAGFWTFLINKSISLSRNRYESAAALYQYIMWKSGPLSTLGGVEGIGFANTKYANVSSKWPDVQFHFISSSYASDRGEYLRHAINLREEYWQEYLKQIKDLESFTILVKLMRPRSRGYIELVSSNITHKPKIVTNYLKDPFDVLVLQDGLKIAKKLGESKAFKRFGSKLFDKPLPGCESTKGNSNKYSECYLRHLTMTIYHYCGTTKMGPYWDPEAVVDSQLRVYGTGGLRVVDASIFPTIPTGNINAAVMMVAEKASHMINSYWRHFRGQGTAPLPENQESIKLKANSDDEINFRGKFRKKRDIRSQILINRFINITDNVQSNTDNTNKDIKNSKFRQTSTIIPKSEENKAYPAIKHLFNKIFKYQPRNISIKTKSKLPLKNSNKPRLDTLFERKNLVNKQKLTSKKTLTYKEIKFKLQQKLKLNPSTDANNRKIWNSTEDNLQQFYQVGNQFSSHSPDQNLTKSLEHEDL